MRVGLVLGAGGVVGASWLIGTLQALSDEAEWDPREAEYIVGTSAGSVIGSLLAGGQSPEQMSAFVHGDPVPEMEAVEDLAGEVDRRAGTEYRLARGLPVIGPGSWRLALSTLVNPRRHAPSVVASGWVPRGFLHTAPIGRLVERFIEDPWPDHPNYWAVACDYTSGRRVPFGRADAPPATVGEAVSASCAIPGFYRPVRIGGRRYIDGGVCSPSNLDLLRGQGLDLVVCLNPISSRAQVDATGAAGRIGAAIRAATGRRLGHEARKLRAEGTEVLLLQPSSEDVTVMGLNLMNRSRRGLVLEQAQHNARRELSELRRSGAVLPGRQPRRSRVAVAAARRRAA